MAAAESVWEAYAGLLAQLQAVFSQVGRDYPDLVSCGRGCDDCCQAPFRVSLIEAVALNSGLAVLDRKTRREVLRRAQKGLERSEELFLDLPSDPQAAALALARQRLRCPLLTEAGCALYRLRPATCRLYGIPTQSGGQSHTCPRSGFEKGASYPTVDLEAVADRLADLSLDLARAGGLSGLALAPRTVARALGEDFPDKIRPG